MGARRIAREHALMILYQVDVTALTAQTGIERFFDLLENGAPLDPPLPFAHEKENIPQANDKDKAQAREYAEQLVRGVIHHRDRIDESIEKASPRWRIDRMARVDRNILRLGTFELLFRSEDVPKNVAINEALEVAKSFGTRDSVGFINGILDNLPSSD